MFTQLTDDLLDLVAIDKGSANGLYAVDDDNQCSSCSASSSLCCSIHICW